METNKIKDVEDPSFANCYCITGLIVDRYFTFLVHRKFFFSSAVSLSQPPTCTLQCPIQCRKLQIVFPSNLPCPTRLPCLKGQTKLFEFSMRNSIAIAPSDFSVEIYRPISFWCQNASPSPISPPLHQFPYVIYQERR